MPRPGTAGCVAVSPPSPRPAQNACMHADRQALTVRSCLCLQGSLCCSAGSTLRQPCGPGCAAGSASPSAHIPLPAWRAGQWDTLVTPAKSLNHIQSACHGDLNHCQGSFFLNVVSLFLPLVQIPTAAFCSCSAQAKAAPCGMLHRSTHGPKAPRPHAPRAGAE
jgi:hypothetical protein